ncbi:unnamed protein product [Rotaria magnacalcarata]|uniref:C2H2-type domain-containing protein n=1 Tax=Rotaria magnacalcarata TaxID=392030 RepID=A0A8S2QHJ7_9BILA|nr:unnamed protein product [Rotaria magnacalcarata]
MPSKNHYFCPLCVESKPNSTFRKLFKHLQYVHIGEANFKIRCELGPLCGTLYSTFASYKTHIYREHADILEETTGIEEVPRDPNICNDAASNLTCNVTDLGSDSEIDDMEDVENEEDEDTDVDDIICWPSFKEILPLLLEKNNDLDSFEKFYLQFLLDLREGHSLPQNIIQVVTSAVRSLIEFIYELLKSSINCSSFKDQQTASFASTTEFILLTDLKNVFTNVIEKMAYVTKNEHHFLKLCRKYFSYESAKEIKLDNPNEVAYYVPIHYSIQQMTSNPYILDILIKNFNQMINRNAHDTDLMFDYRHASQAKLHPVLKSKPDALLFQLYVDEIGLTNPIGAKKDTQKVTMLYFQLADLPDTVKSMVKSIGLLAMCHTKFLSSKSNRLKFFEPIVQDLNTLQTSGIFIPALRTQLNFAFTVLAGDNLGSNDIGGFQKNFNNGQFCRHCHINYDQRLMPLSQISHLHRTRDQHDNLVQQVINLNNDFILQGVVGISPFSKLIGFHATTSLPSDLMHDFNEGVCSQILLAMIKEASAKRILSYGEIEERLMSFEYGLNDKPNKGPAVRKKHLNKGKIVGTASQKMCLFKLFPIIFHEIIDLLDTKEIYICLREIISLVYASPFRKSWLSYLHSLTVRFQCLIVHMLPNVIIPKVHFITHYAKQIEMYGPSIRHWCMRFESKHQMFKQLAVKSNNFKNILYTLSKRHQLRQCLFLSLPNYYKIVREGYSATEKDLCTLPADVRKLLQGNTTYFDGRTKVMEYQRLKFDNIMFIKGSVFVNKLTEEEEIPSFLHVIFILKIDNDWLLIVEQLQTVAFNESLWSYELEHTHLLSIKQPNQLIHVLPKGLDIYELNEKSFVNIFSRLTAEKK